MANSLGTLNSALIVQTALALVFKKFPVLKRFSLDLSNQAVQFNQAVISRIKTVPAVNDFGTGPSNVVDTDVSVTINQFKEVHHAFTPQEYSSTNRDLIAEVAEPMAVAIAAHLVAAAASLFTDANYANPDDGTTSRKTVITVANTAYSTLVKLRKALMLRGCPTQFKKFCLVNADVYEKLLNDPLCNRQAKVTENGTDPITTGELMGVAGFEAITEYPDLPTTDNLLSAAGSPDAIVLAARVPRDPRELMPGTSFPGNLGVVTEPNSGFSIMVNEWIDPATLKANTRSIFMYGKALGNVNNLQRQVSA